MGSVDWNGFILKPFSRAALLFVTCFLSLLAVIEPVPTVCPPGSERRIGVGRLGSVSKFGASLGVSVSSFY